MPSSYRQQLWRSVPLAPLLRTTALQFIAGVLILWFASPTSLNRYAVMGFTALGIVTIPLGRLVANLSRNHPRAYYWSGRAWAAAVPAVFALTISDAYDGSGPQFADTMLTPFLVPCAMGICFAIGAQGALLAVPAELTFNMATVMIAMSAIKLHTARRPSSAHWTSAVGTSTGSCPALLLIYHLPTNAESTARVLLDACGCGAGTSDCKGGTHGGGL